MNDPTIQRARLFELLVRYVWPIQRQFVKHRLARRCRRCAISERHSPLINNLCLPCRTDKSGGGSQNYDATKSDRDLRKMLHENSGKGSWKYDALFMLSGGKDSAYLLDKLRTEFPGLRILALTLDTGFLSPVAVENAKFVAQKLNVDHILFKLSPSVCTKTFRYACTHIPKGKGAFEIVDIEADAILGMDSTKNMAARLGIPLFIVGLDHIQVQRVFNTDSWLLPEEMNCKTEKIFGIGLSELFDQDEQKFFWDPAKYEPNASPKVVFPLHTWRFSKNTILEEVVQKGLIRPGSESNFVTNPSLLVVMILADYNRLGYGSYEPEFAQAIREGNADWKFWRNAFEMMEYSAKTGWLIKKQADEVLSKIGLKRSDVGLP